jgi:hypothetical protein
VVLLLLLLANKPPSRQSGENRSIERHVIPLAENEELHSKGESLVWVFELKFLLNLDLLNFAFKLVRVIII